MNKKDSLSHKNRKDIYCCIENYPGIHHRKISRILNIPFSTCYYHIKNLVKRDLVIEEYDGFYKRYFLNKIYGKKEKLLLNLSQKKTIRNILLYILFTVGASEKEISKELEKNPSLIHHNLKKLVDLGLIEPCPVRNRKVQRIRDGYEIIRSPIGREIVYRLTKDYGQIIYDIFKNYYKSLFKDVPINSCIKWMEECLESEKIPKKRYSTDSSIDHVQNVVSDIFPLPFCA